MALTNIPNIDIEISIPPIIIGGTTLNRKAKLFTMTYNQHEKYLTLSWTVSYYSDNGELIDIKGIDSYSKESIANNTTMVDIQTGAILIPDSTGAYSGNYIGQYDWFNMIAEKQSLNVHNLIRAYGAAATW